MRRRNVLAVLSLIVGSLMTAAALAVGGSFFFVPQGASIRDMSDMVFEGLFIMIGIPLGVLPGIGGMFGTRKGLAVVGTLLSIGALFLLPGLVKAAMSIKGWSWSP